MDFPGVGAPGGASGAPQGYDAKDPNIKKLNALMESCYAKAAMAGVAGFGLGALFGMFMASMAYDTPFHTAVPNAATPAAAATASAAGAAASAATATSSASSAS